MSKKLSMRDYFTWLSKVKERIEELNKENELKSIHWYDLGYRGRNRRLCLLRDNFEVLGCGIQGITQALYLLRGKRLWQD